jgi:glycosyltransferase involved in cell wall biosynthesis
VKSQDYTNIELVVVDGDSEDDTATKVEALLGRNDIFVIEKDNGIYDALNKGIDLSSGDVIGFMHSDDMYVDNRVISSVVDIFNDNDNTDIVYGDACFFSGTAHEKITRVYRSDPLTLKNLSWGKMPAHTAMFVRKAVYQKYGLFKTNYNIAGDYEFLCRLMKGADVSAVYVPARFVKMQTGGISTGGLSNTILLNKEVLRACAENGIYSNLFMILSKYPSKILQFIRK